MLLIIVKKKELEELNRNLMHIKLDQFQSLQVQISFIVFIHVGQFQTGLVSSSAVGPGSQQAWGRSRTQEQHSKQQLLERHWRLVGQMMRYCSVTQAQWLFDRWRHRSAGKQKSSAYTLWVDMSCAITLRQLLNKFLGTKTKVFFWLLMMQRFFKCLRNGTVLSTC